MALKPRYKRRIMWTVVVVAVTAALALVIVPPQLTLNKMRPQITAAIAQRTGTDAQIRGDVHFSLIGGATIAVHDIAVPDGHIDTLMFRVPWTGIFNPANVSLDGDILIQGAQIKIDRLTPISLQNAIEIRNCGVQFLGKEYNIIRATLDGGALRGIVRTADHKYDIDFTGDAFVIKNQSNNLMITGHLYSDGTARGEMAIRTDNINRLFEFDQPKITQPVDMTANFQWDGAYGFDFTDIRGENFAGRIQLSPDGARDIQINAWDADIDFSFLTGPTTMFSNASYDLDLSGNLTFMDWTFPRLRIQAIADDTSIRIGQVVAGQIKLTGGRITANGAENILISGTMDGMNATCLFSGTPQIWKCSEFTLGNLSGSLSVDHDVFYVFVQSSAPMGDAATLTRMAKKLGARGTINFQFSDATGKIEVDADNDAAAPAYTLARDRSPRDMTPELFFIPTDRAADRGNWRRMGDALEFAETSGKWGMRTTPGTFEIWGENFKDWLGNGNFAFLRDLPFRASGDFARGRISNLRLEIGGVELTGRVAGRTLTLHADMLNADTFAAQDFIDNYDELQFLGPSPMAAPFELPVDVSLTADTLIYNANTYRNFVYAVKPGVQTFSISDADNGNILGQIRRDRARYLISAQLNRFALSAPVLAADMPLNIADTTVTGVVNMETSGQIAYDIRHNMTGTVDLTFDGGRLMGIGTDAFFDAAATLTTLNAEYALAAALGGGASRLKSLHIAGKYADGTFRTTAPIHFRLRHVDGRGNMEITNGVMTADMQLNLRGTAPTPVTIDIELQGDARHYSLSEIMMNFDPEYMRDFVQHHDKF